MLYTQGMIKHLLGNSAEQLICTFEILAHWVESKNDSTRLPQVAFE